MCNYLLDQIEHSNSITDRREKASPVRGKHESTFAVDGTQQIGELISVSEYLEGRGPNIRTLKSVFIIIPKTDQCLAPEHTKLKITSLW